MTPHPSFEIAYPSDRSNQLIQPIPHNSDHNHHKPEAALIHPPSRKNLLAVDPIRRIQPLNLYWQKHYGRVSKFWVIWVHNCPCINKVLKSSDNTYIVLVVRHLNWLKLCRYTNADFIFSSQDWQQWKLNSSLDGSSNIYHQNFDHARRSWWV